MTGYLKLAILGACLLIGFLSGWEAKVVFSEAGVAVQSEIALKSLEIKQRQDNIRANDAESKLQAIQSQYESLLKGNTDEKKDIGCMLSSTSVLALSKFPKIATSR